ncbi:MAG: DsbA family oxidoreductase, partial [Chloroflexota bacterium]|nr:DsbA family oxidoreductase [Chloroflexota bacterium]
MRIQVVQDITCPWCRIGKHNLDAAISTWEKQEDDSVQVEWVPFLLDPMERGTKEPYQQRLRTRKDISDEQMREMFTRVTDAGEKIGMTFNYDRIETAPDTIYAHQMIALTPAEHQSALMDAIHTAFFQEGKDIGETVVLRSLGDEVGVPKDALETIETTWKSPELRAELLSVVQQVQQAGITGVPFFIIDSKLGVSGGQ